MCTWCVVYARYTIIAGLWLVWWCVFLLLLRVIRKHNKPCY